jgi:hypothetical protein
MDTITQNCCVRFNKTLNYPDDGARGGAYGYLIFNGSHAFDHPSTYA